MGFGAKCFGLFVILTIILGTENKVHATPLPEPDPLPLPAHYDLCSYLRKHHHRDGPATTAAPAADDKPKSDRIDKIERFGNLLHELLSLEKEAEKKKVEEKKKDEEKKEESKKEEFSTKGLSTSITDFLNEYVQMVKTITYAIYNM